MDPNANLSEQRLIAARIMNCDCSAGDCSCCHDAARLAELVQALDEWLQKGGARPSAWERKS